LERGQASFARTFRLTRPAEYKQVFASATRKTSRAFTVLTIPNGLEHARLGLAISRKAAARAVDRNRIKRIIRESFRCQQRELGSWDIVILARNTAATSTAAVLRTELEQHWNQLKQRPCVPSSS